MADAGVTTNPGVGGPVIDTETNAGRGGMQTQRVKLALGDIDTDAGDVAIDNPMPTAAIGSQNIATGQGTAGTSPALAIAARSGRFRVTIENNSNDPIALGGPTVTFATGKLLPGFSAIDLPTQAAIWAVTGTGTATFDWMEFY